jgi:hypothetical protein
MSPELIMNLDMLPNQLQLLQGRLNLYQETNTAVQPEADLLLAALKELDTTSKKLGIVTEKLFEQTEGEVDFFDGFARFVKYLAV